MVHFANMNQRPHTGGMLGPSDHMKGPKFSSQARGETANSMLGATISNSSRRPFHLRKKTEYEYSSNKRAMFPQ